MAREHTGSWDFHDDDCRCTWVNDYCNRGGWVWSCCGATEKDSDCTTGGAMHPTYWSSPHSGQTIKGFKGDWPEHIPKEEIREKFPELFEPDEDPD